MRSIAVASGKGGVGKTSVSVNLGIVLAKMGRKVVVVDADVMMANLGILLGIERAPISLHNVLIGEVDVKDAVYDGPAGLKYVPAALGMEKLASIDYQRLAQAVQELGENAEFVLVDCPSGLAIDAENALKSCKEVLLVLTPEPASLADALKVKKAAERNNMGVAGVVYNMMTGDKSEIRRSDVEVLMGEKVIAEIPLDLNVRRSGAMQEPVVLKFPDTAFSKAMWQVARHLAGEEAGGGAGALASVKKGLLHRIIELAGWPVEFAKKLLKRN